MKKEIICVYWYGTAFHCAEYLTKAKSFLQGLMALLEWTGALQAVGETRARSLTIDQSFANFEEVALIGLPSQWAFVNADGQPCQLNPGAFSSIGFQNTFATTLDYDEAGCVIELSVGGADEESVSSIVLNLRGDHFNSAERVRRVFEFCVEFWNARHGDVQNELTNKNWSQPMDEIRIGYMTYLRGVSADKIIFNDLVMKFSSGGVFLELSPDRDLLSKMAQLRQYLLNSGFIADPVG